MRAQPKFMFENSEFQIYPKNNALVSKIIAYKTETCKSTIKSDGAVSKIDLCDERSSLYICKFFQQFLFPIFLKS